MFDPQTGLFALIVNDIAVEKLCLMPNGDALLMGKNGFWVWSPATGALSQNLAPGFGWSSFTATLMPAGGVLIDGGSKPGGVSIMSSLFTPPPMTPELLLTRTADGGARVSHLASPGWSLIESPRTQW